MVKHTSKLPFLSIRAFKRNGISGILHVTPKILYTFFEIGIEKWDLWFSKCKAGNVGYLP
jgi:hypothetical protein